MGFFFGGEGGGIRFKLKSFLLFFNELDLN